MNTLDYSTLCCDQYRKTPCSLISYTENVQSASGHFIFYCNLRDGWGGRDYFVRHQGKSQELSHRATSPVVKRDLTETGRIPYSTE